MKSTLRNALIFSLGLITALTSCTTIDFGNKMNSQQDSLLISISNMKMMKSLSELNKEADKLVNKQYKSILDKKIVAPSGKRNDYTSRAIYYWPNKKLNKNVEENDVWVYVDGKVNKESLTDTDHNNYYEMLDAVKKLSLSYHFFKNEEYAEKTSNLIKTWFINGKTKMNPHFNYAQAIPGKNEGTPSGIIDSRGILWVIDAVKLISKSDHWNNELDNKFKEWCTELFDWLLYSEFGKRESAMKNNHGTFYDLQIIKLATYLNQNNIANSFIYGVKNKRIAQQIEPNGFQPEEMKRKSSKMYAVFNLSALLEIATIAKIYDENIWDFRTDQSGSIKDAVDYLLSIADYKNTSEVKNLMRIIPKANELSNGMYKNEWGKLTKKIGHFDLTQLYFVN